MALMIRVSSVLLAAMLAASSTPAAAQALSQADIRDFQMFRHSIAVQLNARVCERAVPGYGQTFGDLYKKWSEKHRDEIARGESLFKEGPDRKDQKGQPAIDRAMLKNVEERVAELAEPTKATGPTPAAAQTTAACEKLLVFLKEEK